jgi:hypothetical protein
MARLVPAWLLTIFAVAVCPSLAVAEAGPPPPLTGETFSTATPTITSVTCFPDQPPFVVGGTFEASGTATGPYPGTFDETVQASITLNVPGFIYDLTASFTIDSSIGRVIGTKHSTNFGVGCGPIDDPNATWSFNTAPLGDPADTYNALIRTPAGSFADSGLFEAALAESFDENFQSSLATSQQIDKDDCKNGGWQTYGFTNLGVCVAFIASGVSPAGTP